MTKPMPIAPGLDLPQPPDHLSAEARDLWLSLVADFDLDDAAAVLLLQTAMEAFDRMRECQAAIAEDGAAVVDRFGQRKPHPLLTTERDCRSQLLNALRVLNLDLAPSSYQRIK